MKTDSKKRIIFIGLSIVFFAGVITSSTLDNLNKKELEYTFVSKGNEKGANPRIEIKENELEETKEPKEKQLETVEEKQPVSAPAPIEKNDIIEETTVEKEPPVVEDIIEEETSPVVYDNMTLEELSTKLDRSLNSTLTGTGNLFASYALQLGIDPYTAVAIVLEETGCKWNCSNLVKSCNNVGGQKGGPSCNGGAYKAYPTLEAGIKGFLDNLYNNYYALGLTTPELINTKYAASTAWAGKINNYIAQIKAT